MKHLMVLQARCGRRWWLVALALCACLGWERQALAIVNPAPGKSADIHMYVAATGSDDNPGTQAEPFSTIQRASQSAQPGTTIHVANGVYAGGFKTTASGSADARIVYISDTQWGARIVPGNSSTRSTLWDNRGDYVDIAGFDIDGSNGSDNWRNGLYTGGSHNVIRNNHVHHIATGVTPDGLGGAGIGTDNFYGGLNDDVIANLVHDIGPAYGSGIQGIYISTSGNVFYNLVYGIQDTCLHSWHNAHHVNFINNTAFNCINGAGIIVGGGSFYNNYSEGNDYSHVANNIVFDSAYGIIENGLTGIHNTYSNNLVFAIRNIDWSLHHGLQASGTIAADPQFVNYVRSGGGDYRLRITSPALGAGSVQFAPPTDRYGADRPPGARIDIGYADNLSSSLSCSGFNCVDLTLRQTVSPDPAAGGKDVILQFTAGNDGPITATSVTLVSPLPRGARFIWASPGCVNLDLSIQCNLGSLASGAIRPVTIVLRPEAEQSMTSSASVEAAQPDLNPENNAISSLIAVAATPPGTPVNRYHLYNVTTWEHFFTTSLGEFLWLGALGWQQYGTMGRLLDNPGIFNGVMATPYYRLYNPSRNVHYWTTDPNDYYNYTSRTESGWRAEGVDGYILPVIATGSVELFQMMRVSMPGLRYWCVDLDEYNTLTGSGEWIGEGGIGAVIQ